MGKIETEAEAGRKGEIEVGKEKEREAGAGKGRGRELEQETETEVRIANERSKKERQVHMRQENKEMIREWYYKATIFQAGKGRRGNIHKTKTKRGGVGSKGPRKRAINSKKELRLRGS